MASNFNKAERYVKQGDEYKLLSYATSSESVIMTDGTDLQTKMDSIPTLTFEDTEEIIFNATDVSPDKQEISSDTFSTEAEAEDYVFFSSWYGSYGRYGWKAFDGDTSTQWCCQSTDNMNGEYIGYNFGKAIEPSSLKIVYKNSNQANPSFIIQGSNGDDAWDDLSEEVSQTVNGTYTETYDISSQNKYSMFRRFF